MQRMLDRLVAAILAAFLAGSATASAAAESHWSYTGPTGPARWGKLDKEFATCATGTVQSPIDIHDASVRKGDLAPLLFNYKPSPLSIVDDGHTIVVNYAPGSFLTVEGKRYELATIDFHKPSEMKIDGKDHAMAAHLVHKDKDGRIAMVAVLLDQGKENALVKTLWSHLPPAKGKANEVAAVKIDAYALLPASKDYYAFMGSLTTPPCTENIPWYVLKEPVSVSADQVARFARIYPMNARPTQPLNDRDVQGSR